MRKKLKGLLQEIDQIQGIIESEGQRLKETESRVGGLKKSLDPLFEDLKKKLVEGQERNIRSMEEAFDQRKGEIERDETLIIALHERLENLNHRLAEAKTERDRTFNALAEDWLRKEVKTFDHYLDGLNRATKRLLAAFYHLRESGGASVYTNILGDAFTYIPGLKVFSISNFDSAIFRTDAVRADGDDLKNVYREILEG